MPATTTLALRDPPVPAPAAGSAAGLVALADRCVKCGLCLPHWTQRSARATSPAPGPFAGAGTGGSRGARVVVAGMPGC